MTSSFKYVKTRRISSRNKRYTGTRISGFVVWPLLPASVGTLCSYPGLVAPQFKYILAGDRD